MNRRLLLSFGILLLCFSTASASNTLGPSAKLQEFDNDGAVCSGCYLYTYDTGTTTPRATKVSKDGALNTNPIILDSAGRANIWIDSSPYRFVLKEADDSTVVYTVDDITSLPEEATFSSITATGVEINDLDGVINIGNRYMIDATEADQGVNSFGYPTTLKTVNDYIDYLGSREATLVFSHSTTSVATTYTFATSETIPENIKIELINGSKISVNSTKTLTIYSPEHVIAPNNTEVFDGSGTVSFTVGGVVDSYWFGFNKSGNSDAENAAALTSAMGSMSKGEVIIHYNGTIGMSAVTIPAHIILSGINRYTTVLKNTLGEAFITLSNYSVLRNISLEGAGKVSGSIGIYGDAANHTIIEKVRCTLFEYGEKREGGIFCSWQKVYWDSNTTGFLGEGDGAAFSANDFFACRANSNTNDGMELTAIDKQVQGNSFVSLDFEGNDVGLRLEGVRCLTFEQVWFEDNENNHLVVNDGAAGVFLAVSFKGCVFNASELGGVYILGTTGSELVFDSCFLTSGHTWTIFGSNLRPVHLRDSYITPGIVFTDTNSKLVVSGSTSSIYRDFTYPDFGDGNRKVVKSEGLSGLTVDVEKQLAYLSTTDATISNFMDTIIRRW